MYLVAKTPINDYANAMFRRERLYDGWLDDCAGYLQKTFGDSLNGARVVDYGCGQGNWSLAFLRAGAKHVLAVDAAIDNVRRLHDFCRQNEVQNIDIVHGDLLVQNIEAEPADIVWLYGVLHHVPRPQALLRGLTDMAPDKSAQFYIYGYDAGSLRQFTIDTARQLYPRPNEDAFRLESMPLTRDARIRARDNLLAPHIDWYCAGAFAELLSAAGLEPVARSSGFDAFMRGHGNAEFQPHEALCRNVPADDVILWSEPERDYCNDIAVLSAVAREINFAVTEPADRMRVALGLMNTHFSHLGDGASCADAIVELFLYMVYVLDVHGGSGQAEGLAADFLELADAAMGDAPRLQLRAASHPSNLARFLRENSIRL